MNLSQLIRTDTYYTYEQDDDLVNDAAQFFARYLHKSWWSTNEFSSSSNKNKYNYKLNIVDNQTIHRANPSNDDDKTTDDDNQEWTSNKPNLKNKNHLNQYENREVGGILIFLSIEDRICFISAGPIVSSVLPWWRLERVITDMKPNLHRGSYDEALLGAIEDLAAMIESGSPTSSERMIYFLSRYGVVLAFAIFTFIFAAWGEFRENRNRWEYIEARTSMTKFEKDKARGLQKQFRDLMCPICLENFQFGDEKGTESRFGQILESDSSYDDPDNKSTTSSTSLTLKRVDSYGIPLLGNDGLPLKMLRCGHVFDQTCWKLWAHSGQGNPCKCPVCRQDVGTCIQVLSHEQSQGPETPRMTNTTRQQRDNATSIAASTSSTPLSVSTGNRTNYNSILQSDHQTNEGYDFMVVIDVESNQ